MRPRRQAAPLAIIALATSALYAAWLAWDQQKNLNPVTLVETGPYERWQIVGLVLCFGVLAFAAGWRRSTPACLLAMPLTMAVCVATDWLTGPDSGLWIVGVGLLAVGTLLGALAAAYAGVIARLLVGRRGGGTPV